MANFTGAQIEQLWIQNGGSSAAAQTAAAIALAESGGDPNATNNNTNGSVDKGLFQINTVNGALSTYNLVANIKAAIQLSNNGQNWNPWTTYTSGKYKQFLGQAPAATPVGGSSGLNLIPGTVIPNPLNSSLPNVGISNPLSGLDSAITSVWNTAVGDAKYAAVLILILMVAGYMILHGVSPRAAADVRAAPRKLVPR